jgi:purine-binding chemotaxis protein CheW
MDETQSDSLTENDSKTAANQRDGFFAKEGGASYSQTNSVHKQKMDQIDDASKKRILRERAKKLSQKRSAEDSDTESLQVIEFKLSQERYAAQVNYVREVFPLKDVTPIPCTPSFVLGIMNVRGQVVSVLDIRNFFDLPAQANTELSKVLIVGKDDIECGILTDEIIGEKRVPLEMIHTDGHLIHGAWEDCIMGVTPDRLIVIEMDKLLSDEKLIVQQEVGDR